MDEELDKGHPMTYVARLMTSRGFPISDGIVSTHVGGRHRADYETNGGERVVPKVTKRDAARVIKDRILDKLDASPNLDILDKDLQPALKTALGAQAIEDKREAKKVTQNFWVELGAGLFQERARIEAPLGAEVVDGTAVEVDE